MADILFGAVTLAALVLLGIYWALKEDERRAKVKKMDIPKHIDDSLDEIERKIS